MNRRKNKRRWIVLIFILFLLLAFFMFMRHRLSPMVRELAVTRVSNEASFAINRAIDRQIRENHIDYDRIIMLEKDVQGAITALKTNIAEVNRLQTMVLSMVDEEVLELSTEEIGIPLGNLIFPDFLSGKGPLLPIRIIAVSTSDAYFSSSFSAAGINQTLHRITLTVSATMAVLTPTETLSVNAESSMIVAETVIIGTVPHAYFSGDLTT